VLHGLWIHDLLCGRLRSARARADDLLQLAEAEQDDSWTLIGCRARGVLGYPLGEFQVSRRMLERGLALFMPERRPDYSLVLVDDPRVVMLMYLAWVLVFLGEEAEARKTIADCLAEARALGQPYNLAHALSGRILTGLFIEDYGDLLPIIDELAALTAEHEIAFYAAVCRVLRGRYLARMEEGDAGARLLETALESYRATGSILYLPTFMMWQADAVGRAGRIEEALTLIDQAKSLVEQSGMENDAAEILRVEGELHRLAGNAAAAKSAFDAALAVATRQESPFYADRARASLESLVVRRREVRIP
jgi:tetratricopeptide (TPR) repeat protein